MLAPRFVRWIVSAALFGFAPAAAAEEAVAPTAAIHPFEQNDLRAFTVWTKKAKHEDPQHVFQLAEGVLRCGDEDLGYVATKQAYKDYRLTVEYRWGRKNPNDKYVRNSGILLHGVGPDGSAGGAWMTSLECQLAQGCEGDLILIPGTTAEGKPYPATCMSTTRKASDGKTRFDPQGEPTKYSGRQFWWSNHEPGFEELIDTRGKDDVASKLGEWTKVECLARGNRTQIKINGQLVNEVYDHKPEHGKILLQAEGHEVFFRNLEIGPLPPATAEAK